MKLGSIRTAVTDNPIKHWLDRQHPALPAYVFAAFIAELVFHFFA